jgi:single-strand DNA-binding protein
MNIVILTGRLTAEPALTTTPNGTQVCSVTIAVDRGYGDNKQTDFIPLVLWKNKAVALCRYCKKGDKINVVGTLQSRSYQDQDGKKRTAYEVNVNLLELPERKKEPAEVHEERFLDTEDDEDLPF